jgi:transposase
MTYPLAMRKHILDTKEREKLTFQATADRFNIGIATLMRWSHTLEPQLTRNKPALKIDMEQLANDVLERPDDYQHERAARFGVSRHGIYAALKRLGVTRKKNTDTPEGERRKESYVRRADSFV